MALFGVTKQFHNKFTFDVEIAGIRSASFASCSKISGEIAVIDHWEGGSIIPDSSPGRVTFPEVTLSRGATDDLDLYAWFQQVVDADAMVVEPDHERTLDIVQRDRKRVELRRWTLVRAWVKGYSPGEWDNNSDEKNMEEVVLKYRYFIPGGDTTP